MWLRGKGKSKKDKEPKKREEEAKEKPPVPEPTPPASPRPGPLQAHGMRPPPSGPLTPSRTTAPGQGQAPPVPPPPARPKPKSGPLDSHGLRPPPSGPLDAGALHSRPVPPPPPPPPPPPVDDASKASSCVPGAGMGTGPEVKKADDASKASACVPGAGMGAGAGVSRSSRKGVIEEWEEEKPAEVNPFEDFGGPSRAEAGAGPVLQASFPEMEARKKPLKKKEPDEVFDQREEEDPGDPLLASAESDDWAASDSFREKRRSMTRRHKKSQQKKSKELFHQGSRSSDSGDQGFLEGEGDDEWRPSDSQQIAPMRELQGLGAHDEDQFEDEEEDGLGTRMLAREADDMERDAVDEEFFSDIDVSLEDYSEAIRDEVVDSTVRVVRKLDDTQFLDYDELEKIAIEADGEASEEAEAPLPAPAPSREGTVAAVPLSEADFGRALRRIPVRQLSRLVDPIIEQKVLSCEPISRQEFETLFGDEF